MFSVDYTTLTQQDIIHCLSYARHALSTEQGVHQTFLIAQQLITYGIEGCFVECGVAAGAQVAAMWRATAKHGVRRKIHLFDSFKGIPLAGPRDHDQPGLDTFIADRNLPIEERLRSSGVSECSVETVVQLMRTWEVNLEDLVFHEGWFQDTLPSTAMPPIAFLRLDGDLYESTECCLKWLYPCVVSGGVVLLDDYPLSGSRLAFEDYFMKQHKAVPAVIKNVNTGAAWWIKP